MAVIGIDFGTTQSKAAVVCDANGRVKTLPNAEGEDTTPTVVSFEQDGQPNVGREAANEALARPEHTLTDFKLELGSDKVLYTTASGKPYTATDCTALVLEKLKRDAEQLIGEAVTGAVVTVPANFQDDQKHALLQAAKQAGLDVLQLLHEPTSAAVAYGADKREDQTILVSDMGGGTYDASIVRCQEDRIDVLGTDGIPDLGGGKYSQVIQDYVLENLARTAGYHPDPEADLVFFQDLRDRAEQAKFTLSVKDRAKINLSAGGEYHTVELTRDEFDDMIAESNAQVVETCEGLLKDCGLNWETLDRALLVGGGSKVASVREAMEKAFGRPVSRDIDPLKAISYGAAIQAAVQASGSNGTVVYRGRALPAPKVTVRDVTAHAIGCCVEDPNLEEINAVIIPRHSSIPCEREDVFRLEFPDQAVASVQILQGDDGAPASGCLKIGELILENLPPDKNLPKRIRVLYKIDGNGMCTAYAEDLLSGKNAHMRFDYSRSVSKSTAS